MKNDENQHFCTFCSFSRTLIFTKSPFSTFHFSASVFEKSKSARFATSSWNFSSRFFYFSSKNQKFSDRIFRNFPFFVKTLSSVKLGPKSTTNSRDFLKISEK